MPLYNKMHEFWKCNKKSHKFFHSRKTCGSFLIQINDFARLITWTLCLSAYRMVVVRPRQIIKVPGDSAYRLHPYKI